MHVRAHTHTHTLSLSHTHILSLGLSPSLSSPSRMVHCDGLVMEALRTCVCSFMKHTPTHTQVVHCEGLATGWKCEFPVRPGSGGAGGGLFDKYRLAEFVQVSGTGWASEHAHPHSSGIRHSTARWIRPLQRPSPPICHTQYYIFIYAGSCPKTPLGWCSHSRMHRRSRAHTLSLTHTQTHTDTTALQGNHAHTQSHTQPFCSKIGSGWFSLEGGGPAHTATHCFSPLLKS